jgi:hypothetical protein
MTRVGVFSFASFRSCETSDRFQSFPELRVDFAIYLFSSLVLDVQLSSSSHESSVPALGCAPQLADGFLSGLVGRAIDLFSKLTLEFSADLIRRYSATVDLPFEFDHYVPPAPPHRL